MGLNYAAGAPATRPVAWAIHGGDLKGARSSPRLRAAARRARPPLAVRVL